LLTPWAAPPLIHRVGQVGLRLTGTSVQFLIRIAQASHCLGIGQDGNRLFECVEILGSDKYCGRSAVHGHRDSLVVDVDATDQFGQVRLDLGKRKCGRRGHKYDYY